MPFYLFLDPKISTFIENVWAHFQKTFWHMVFEYMYLNDFLFTFYNIVGQVCCPILLFVYNKLLLTKLKIEWQVSDTGSAHWASSLYMERFG